jgi:hypothetical protein
MSHNFSFVVPYFKINFHHNHVTLFAAPLGLFRSQYVGIACCLGLGVETVSPL